jgi:hypothetical protein
MFILTPNIGCCICSENNMPFWDQCLLQHQILGFLIVLKIFCHFEINASIGGPSNMSFWNQCPHCWTFQYVILRSMTPLLDLPVCHFEINASIVGPSSMSFWDQCPHCWTFQYVILKSMPPLLGLPICHFQINVLAKYGLIYVMVTQFYHKPIVLWMTSAMFCCNAMFI